MSNLVRPIYLPGATALDSLRQRAQAAFDEWAGEWVIGWQGDASPQLQISAATSDEEWRAHDAYQVMRSATGCIWFRSNAFDQLNFDRAIVGFELMPDSICADEWIASVLRSAREARNRALCTALLGAPILGASPESSSAVRNSLFAFGSGAVQLTCERLGVHVVADSAVWRSVPPIERAYVHAKHKLVPLERALLRAKIRLDIMLGSVEVELPKLMDLRCGDLLRLPQRLDQGIAVLGEGKLLARADLGEQQGRKCVRLAASH